MASCDAECESVSHVLWDCPAYDSIRSAFMLELRRELGDRFEHFQSLDSFEKSSYVLGSEAWGKYSSGLLGLIKDFVLRERKVRLYGEHANVHQSYSQNDSGDLRGVAGGDGELGCLCGKAGTSHLCDGSAHSSGCVVNGYGCRLSWYIINQINMTLHAGLRYSFIVQSFSLIPLTVFELCLLKLRRQQQQQQQQQQQEEEKDEELQ